MNLYFKYLTPYLYDMETSVAPPLTTSVLTAELLAELQQIQRGQLFTRAAAEYGKVYCDYKLLD